MKRFALAGGVVLALGFSSVALGDHNDSRDVFVGECAGEGFVFYPTSSERLKDQAQDLDVRIEADVECNGELNGEPIEDSLVYMTASKDDEKFGVGSSGDRDGGRLDDLEGNLNFVAADGEKLFTRMTTRNPQQDLELEGERGGRAAGQVQPVNAAQVIQRAEGEGARVVVFTVEFVTRPQGIRG